MRKTVLNPTPDQTFEVIGEGPCNFVRVLARSREMQAAGDVEGACNERFQAFQRLAELIPEDEEINLEWNHANSRAALEVIHASAIDHFLINDFELSAALLEMLLELDPEDHLEGSELLAFDYLAMDEQELFDEFTRDENGQVVMSEEEGRKKIEKLGGYDKLYRIKFEADYLAKLTMDGARKRYGENLSDEVQDRLRFELHIMKTMGFPGYFLIVQDFIRAAREELDVSVGPGRGSAAGSAVAYCLGITQIDPIAYDLLFERFLNPDRISLPDIDVDFDDDGRGRVLNWVTQKYGKEKVARIVT